ncbi:MAG: hypothetical protein AUI14_20865 [Actinobacteria bacterium 13_2_20CM_2_71_6]|nr:MAG: hypothetical protein AUI14_20865 [Actinobacteria bacterium 13_2_20CM_2_71_6]
MARGNPSDKNLRNEAQAELQDLSDDAATGGLSFDDDITAEGTEYIGDQTGTGTNQTGTGKGATAMRTKATPKTAAQQSTSMQTKKSNQPPNR